MDNTETVDNRNGLVRIVQTWIDEATPHIADLSMDSVKTTEPIKLAALDTEEYIQHSNIFVEQVVNNYKKFRRQLGRYAESDLYDDKNKLSNLLRDVDIYKGSISELENMLSNGCIIPYQKDVTKNAVIQAEMLQAYYETIYIDSSYIVGITKPIITTYKKTTYNFGQFVVKVHWRKEPTICAHCDNPSIGRDAKHPHPHITNERECCFGDFVKPIMKLVGERRYLDVLVILHQYLCTINPDSTYTSPTNWLPEEIAEDICEDCLAHVDDCDCNRCEYCDNPLDDCDCARCPSSGDRIDDDQECCAGCSEWYSDEDPDVNEMGSRYCHY